ncbi:unnamed protein product [Ectocarpus sp. 13 AM-2016]
MDVPDAFLLQASRPPALDQSLVKRGVLVELGLGWFGGLIARTASQSSRRTHDYRVTLHSDGSTSSVELPLEFYSTDEAAAIGA